MRYISYFFIFCLAFGPLFIAVYKHILILNDRRQALKKLANDELKRNQRLRNICVRNAELLRIAGNVNWVDFDRELDQILNNAKIKHHDD